MLETRMELSDEDFRLRWYNTQDLENFKTEARNLSRELRNGTENITNTVANSSFKVELALAQSPPMKPAPVAAPVEARNEVDAKIGQQAPPTPPARPPTPSTAQPPHQQQRQQSDAINASRTHQVNGNSNNPAAPKEPMATPPKRDDDVSRLDASGREVSPSATANATNVVAETTAAANSESSLVDELVPARTTCTDKSRGLEYRICLDRQKHKVLALKCILKAQAQFQRRPDTLAQVARKCTAWATEVALTVASRDFCEAYKPHLLHLIPGIQTPCVSGFPLPFKKKRKANNDGSSTSPQNDRSHFNMGSRSGGIPTTTNAGAHPAILGGMNVVSPIDTTPGSLLTQGPSSTMQSSPLGAMAEDARRASTSPSANGSNDPSGATQEDEEARRVRRRTATMCH